MSRTICCSACGHSLLDVKALCKTTTRLQLQDGEAFVAEEAPGIKEGDEYITTDQAIRYQLYFHFDLRAATMSSYWVRLRALECGGCGLYLGCRFLSFQPTDGPADDGSDDDDSGGGLAGSDRAAAALAGRAYLTWRYTYRAKQDGSQARGEAPFDTDLETPIRCAGMTADGRACLQPLFRRGDLLRQQPSGHGGLSHLVNTVMRGSVEAACGEAAPDAARGFSAAFSAAPAFRCSRCASVVGAGPGAAPAISTAEAAHWDRSCVGRYVVLGSSVVMA